MERLAFYSALEKCRFSAVTGPTFSINAESQEHPAAHNVIMLLRHHRVLDEVGSTGLMAIPNLYWRTARDRRRWAEWLGANPTVRVVSRDFTCTSYGKPFWEQFRGLVEIMGQVDRSLHVITQGVSKTKAAAVLEELAKEGGTASLVTSSPILKGHHGEKWHYRGAHEPEVQVGSQADRSALAVHNLQVMERHLQSIADELAPYHEERVNGQLQELLVELVAPKAQTSAASTRDANTANTVGSSQSE